MPVTDMTCDSKSVTDRDFPPVTEFDAATHEQTARELADALTELPGIRARKRTTSVTIPGNEPFLTAYVIVTVSFPEQDTVRNIADKLESLEFELVEADNPFPSKEQIVSGDVSPRTIFREWVLTPRFYSGYGPRSDTRDAWVWAYDPEQ